MPDGTTILRKPFTRRGLTVPQLRYLFETFNLASAAEFLGVAYEHASLVRKQMGFPRGTCGLPSAAHRASNGAAPTSRYFG